MQAIVCDKTKAFMEKILQPIRNDIEYSLKISQNSFKDFYTSIDRKGNKFCEGPWSLP